MRLAKTLITTLLLTASLSSAHAFETTQTTIDFEDDFFKGYWGETLEGEPIFIGRGEILQLSFENVTFSGLARDNTPSSFKVNSSPVASPDYTDYSLATSKITSLKLDFSNPVLDFSFNLFGNQNEWNIVAFDDAGSIINSAELTPLGLYNLDNAGAFFGLSSEEANISYATINNLGPLVGGFFENQIRIDNLTYTEVSPVPEPSTYALMLGGLGMVGFMAYRRRKTTNI